VQKEVGQFCDFLKRKQLKVTPQRLRIAESVFATHKHFTADQLYALVKKVEPLVGKVTVYRTLEQLVESGMVDEFSIKKGVSTYEHVVGHEHHDHLLCTNCGRVEELSSQRLEKLKKEEAEAKGFEVHSHSLKIYGLCAQCRPRS
jgi:Fur family ferric uptake transcriptional regulator